MAKKLKLQVTFALTVGASTDVIESLEAVREELRNEVAAKGLEEVRAKAAGQFPLFDKMLDESVDIEEVFVETVLTGTRLSLKELNESDRAGNFQRIGDISVKVV
ncbi:conserved hypothetical protein [Pseudomonas phage phiIBB-PF7A]|uniref:Uncharacterized protein n=1 Tax=Pseudomonas phage phiIBB-PF7A TaxID=942165 RepID=E9KIF8_9CAUD|nr:Gp5.5-like host HNS inhibition [Pseudomonas phage phiIBB-PF7A]ADV35683.1 conserved hypothetical protein [Pseudomonas phage phiIBB-PF7A]